MKIFGAFARFFSTVLSPLLMPTYGVFLAFWVSLLCYIPFGTRMMVIVVVFGITCILPIVFIALLHNAKLITDKRLLNARERWLPYVFSALCYVGAFFYLKHIHCPGWLTAFMIGGVVSVCVSCAVNMVWKISAHSAGIAGVLALLLAIHDIGLSAFNLEGTICVTILLCGCVCTSRILLDRHNVLQTLAGAANGLLCVYFAIRLFG
ncbi:MAG: hypothetical protein ACI308_06420 [Muribaculaceae bacterium]